MEKCRLGKSDKIDFLSYSNVNCNTINFSFNVKWLPVVNFINILFTNFLYKSASCSFSLVTIWLCNWRKAAQSTSVRKSICKMLMKLTLGLNFINVLCTAFTLIGSKSVKRYWQLDWVLTLWGATGVKAVHRMLMKSSPCGR